MNKRLGIFACSFGKTGKTEEYVFYLLREMKKTLTTLVVVCNGKLQAESRRRLREVADTVVCRKNEGFDAAAWQFAMRDVLGWDEVRSYDELVLFNDTFFGPFYPMEEVFQTMDARPVDFWGLTCHYEANDGFGTSSYRYLPTHIQSYFLVIRAALLRSYEFQDYWEQLPILHTFGELVGKNEVVFTHHFEECGFSWDVYVDSSSRRSKDHQNNYNLYVHEPYWLVKKQKFPILKKKNFSYQLFDYLHYTNGHEMYECMEYIKQHTEYDTNLIWDYLLRNEHFADIFYALGLQYVLSEDHAEPVSAEVLYQTLIIMHVYYDDQMDYVEHYVDAIPSGIHILMTTSRRATAERLKECFGTRDDITIRVVENRGRDVSALLIAARDVIEPYAYLCFVHDKRTPTQPRCVAQDFQSLLWENLLSSKAYILNILHCFASHERLGLLVPPTPMHGVYSWLLGNRWSGDFPQTAALAKHLGIHVPMDEAKDCLALGTAFWCRREALKLLWEHPWTYEDFPEEPLPADGTVSHAIDRIFPYAAQEAGYFTAWVMTPRQSVLDDRNSRYLLEKMMARLRAKQDPLLGLGIAGMEAGAGNLGPANAYNHFFPYHLFHRGDRVMLYGAGNIGKQFYRQAVHDGYLQVVGIVDKNAATMDKEGIPVESIEALQSRAYDYVLITMNKAPVAESGRADILALGIPAKKIKWDGAVYYRDHFYQQYYYPLMDKINPKRKKAEELL